MKISSRKKINKKSGHLGLLLAMTETSTYHHSGEQLYELNEATKQTATTTDYSCSFAWFERYDQGIAVHNNDGRDISNQCMDARAILGMDVWTRTNIVMLSLLFHLCLQRFHRSRERVAVSRVEVGCRIRGLLVRRSAKSAKSNILQVTIVHPFLTIHFISIFHV